MHSRKKLAENFKSIEHEASSGHYFDRIIAIATAAGFHSEVALLQANKNYLDGHCKPAGLDALIADVSFGVVSVAKRKGVTDAELKPIVWGLDWHTLERFKLIKLRANGTNQQKGKTK